MATNPFGPSDVYVGRDVSSREVVVTEADVRLYEDGTEDRNPCYHHESPFGVRSPMDRLPDMLGEPPPPEYYAGPPRPRGAARMRETRGWRSGTSRPAVPLDCGTGLREPANYAGLAELGRAVEF